jgi:Ca2+-dependent lipid-binding protein
MKALKMYISVWDYDYDGNDLIGKGEVDLSTLVHGTWVNERIALFDEKGFSQTTDLYIQAQWT